MKAKHENLCTGSNSLVIGMNNTCNHDDCLMIGTGLTTTMHGQVLIGNNKNVQSGAITPEDLREFKQILLQSLGGVTWQAEQSAELERLRGITRIVAAQLLHTLPMGAVCSCSQCELIQEARAAIAAEGAK